MSKYSGTNAKNLQVYNPSSFDPLKVLPPELHPYADDARYFLHLIFRKTVMHKEYRNKTRPVCLMAKFLQNQMHRTLYRPIIDALISGGVVESDRQYIIGQKSIGYWLAPAYRDDKIVRLPLTSKPISKRVAKRTPESLPSPVHEHLYRCLKATALDMHGASAWVAKWDRCHKPNTTAHV